MYVLTSLTFFENLRLTQAKTSEGLKGDVFDLGRDAAARDIGSGQPLYVVIFFHSNLSAANRTLKFKVVTADNAKLTRNPIVLGQTDAFDNDDIHEIQSTVITLPSYDGAYKRYLGIRLQNTGSANLASSHGVNASAILSDVPFGHRHVLTNATKE